MPTETITLQYGPIGGLTSSTFSWTVTNVSATGSFVDGTPWIVVGSGAQLIDVSPKSELKTSTAPASVTTGSITGITFYISGTAKNLKARYYTDPNFTFTPYTRGTTGSGRWPLDSRYCASGLIGDTLEEIQADFNSFYDASANIGIPGASGYITPVSLTGGDVIVTANSMWHRGQGIESQEFISLFGFTFSTFIPNSVDGWRTGIKELGVLTVLKQAPSEPSFRPPFQWITGSESTRPDPIPVSAVGRTQEQLLFHNTTIPSNLIATLGNPNIWLRSPIFHEGHDVKNQSSNGVFSYYSGSNSNTMRSNWTYLSTNAIRVFDYLTIMAFNQKYQNNSVSEMPTFGGTVSQNWRTVARNRLIQYGIDCYGAFMSMADTYGTAGHRGGEAKSWILLAGYLLRNSSMLNMLNSFRTQYNATIYASLTDDQILERKFADDAVVFQIGATYECGKYIRQTFEPNTAYVVQTAYERERSLLYSSITMISGKFATFTVSKCNLYSSEVSCSHCKKGINYYGAYVQVTSGPGNGNTTYRIIRANPTSSENGPNEFILDRPWVHGTPDTTSTIIIFGVRDGKNPDGSTADIGRYVYNAAGIERIGNDLTYFRRPTLSPNSDNYSSQFINTLQSHLLFKKLFQGEFITPGVTGVNAGLTAFFIGKTWKFINEFVNGTNQSIVATITGNQETISNCPNGQNLSNLTWFDNTIGSFTSYNNVVYPIWRTWLEIDENNETLKTFGYQNRDRLPGKDLQYDSLAIAKILTNFGRTGGGGSDITGDGLTDATDLTFILDRWGS